MSRLVDKALDDRRGVLGVNHAGGADRTGDELGAVAGVRLHVQDLHAGHNARKGQHLGGLPALIGLPVGIAAIRGGDDGLIVGGLAGLLRKSRRKRKHEQGEHAGCVTKA